MQEEKPKDPSKDRDIATLVVLSLIVSFIGSFFLFEPMNIYMPHGFLGPIGILVVLGFDISWIIFVKFYPFKESFTKTLLIWLVLTLSASVLICWVRLNAFSKAL